ncbi:MAG: hypothetical protein V4498_08260 [candidate division FCPU426 bacterium]
MIRALRYRLEYAFVLAGAWLVQSLSLESAQAFARFLGRCAWGLGVARRTSLDNLVLAFNGEKTKPERRKIAKAAYEGFAQTMIELARMPVTSPEEIESYFEFENLELLHTLQQAGKGAICLSAHYGNWEWMGAALIKKGFPMTFMIGTQSNPHVDRLFNEYRGKVGIKFVRIRHIKEVVKGLRNGEFMALLGDQDGDKWGTFVDFFGRHASTHTIGDILARKTGAPTFFGVSQRLGPRKHFVSIVPMAEAPAGLSEIQASAFRLQEYNNHLEAAIRRDPGQWLWMHRRWQSQPFHRLSGAERVMAEKGGALFDPKRQAWVSVANGEVLDFSTWKS